MNATRATLLGNMVMSRDIHHFMGSLETSPQEKWQSSLPLSLHRSPRRTLFIGLGTGITAGEALRHEGVEDVTIVELIPEVLDAARLFAPYNGRVLDDPRVTTVVNDGRHFLAATGRSFDVIVADLLVPWESQTGYLYTVEHYRTARERLNAGGLVCQWLPTWQLRARELVMIIDSFASSFPHVSVWWEDSEAFVRVALIGSDHQLSPVESARRTSGTDWRSLYAGEWQSHGPRTLNTDEHPRVEFQSPFVQFEKAEQLVLRERVVQALKSRLVRIAPSLE